MTAPTLNGLRVISCKLTIPYLGVWVADIQLDLEDVALLPPADSPAILIIGLKSMRGVIDGRGSGSFSTFASVRVIGGNAGWEKEVPAQHFYNPGGALLSTIVYNATAPLVGEVVLDPSPQVVGPNFARMKGPARRIFGDRQWFVEPITGITTVADWPTLPQNPDDVVIVDYDINAHRVAINTDEVFLPGTLLIDERFSGGRVTARDVTQTFDKNGGSGEVWVSESPVSRLQSALTHMVREFGQTDYLKTYLYRFVVPVGGKLALQAITPGAPDLNPIDQWTGLSGITASLVGVAALQPATEIVVGFAGGDAKQPYIAAFSPLATPLGLTLNASTFVRVGPAAVSPVALSIGVAAAISGLQFQIIALSTLLNGVAGPPLPAGPATSAIATGIAATVAGLVQTPSHKLFSE